MAMPRLKPDDDVFRCQYCDTYWVEREWVELSVIDRDITHVWIWDGPRSGQVIKAPSLAGRYFVNGYAP